VEVSREEANRARGIILYSCKAQRLKKGKTMEGMFMEWIITVMGFNPLKGIGCGYYRLKPLKKSFLMMEEVDKMVPTRNHHGEGKIQITFGMVEDRNRRKKETMLDKVLEIIDFTRIERMLTKMYSGQGRPPIPPLMLFKALLLEWWYGLSDVQVVREIHDRRSFERFVGEQVRQYHLDDTTLVKFRERLRCSGMMKRVWKEVERALLNQGLKVTQGTIVDSTLVKGACRPESKCKDGGAVDEDLGYTARKGQAVDGYKVHVGMEAGDGMIHGMELSRIEEHDHQHFKSLIPCGTKQVYAGKAYASQEHERYLAEKGIQSRVLFKGYRNRELTAGQREKNRKWSRIRSRIEAKMNDLKRWCSMGQMRYYGLERNRISIMVCGLASNLKRATVLTMS